MKALNISIEKKSEFWRIDASERSKFLHSPDMIIPSSISEYKKRNLNELQTKLIAFFAHYFFLIGNNGSVFCSDYAAEINECKKEMDLKCNDLITIVFDAYLKGYL